MQPWTPRTAIPVLRPHRASDDGKLPNLPILRRETRTTPWDPFLELAEQVFERFRPDLLLTYGGHPASLELMRRARRRGVAVDFHLHNFGYSEPKGSDSKNDRRAFANVSTVIFPSEYSRRHHARLLGLDGPVIPDPIPLERIVADNPEPQYVTFVNPQLPKGVTVFARIAIELNRKRSDIPLLIGAMPVFDRIFDLQKTGKRL